MNNLIKNKKFQIIFLSLIIGTLFIGTIPAESSTFPGTNGKIAFERVMPGGNIDIFTMNPDGSGEINLTNGLVTENYLHPSWSSDGLKIVFSSNKDSSPSDVWIMNADGTGQTRISPVDANSDIFPSFSPDGTQIAWETDQTGNFEIFVMDSDGSNPVNISNNISLSDTHPNWSFDGTRIVFSSGGDIFTMNPDGTVQTQLTSGVPNDGQPCWSPDDTKITYQRGFGIRTMDSDGMNDIAIGTGQHPCYSPDGSKILFYSSGVPFDITTMDTDGMNVLAVAATAGINELFADWGPFAGATSVNLDEPVYGAAMTLAVAEITLHDLGNTGSTATVAVFTVEGSNEISVDLQEDMLGLGVDFTETFTVACPGSFTTSNDLQDRLAVVEGDTITVKYLPGGPFTDVATADCTTPTADDANIVLTNKIELAWSENVFLSASDLDALCIGPTIPTCTDRTITSIDGSGTPFLDIFFTGGATATDVGQVRVNEQEIQQTAEDAGGNSVGTNVIVPIGNSLLPPTITLIKTVSNTGGGTKVATDFQLTIDLDGAGVGTAVNANQNEAITVTDGVEFTVTEDAVAGYPIADAVVTGTGCGTSLPISMTLNNGETAECTITNHDDDPTLKVNKDVTNNNGGDDTPILWTITVTNNAVAEPTFGGVNTAGGGTTLDLNVGSFSVAEAGNTGYTLTTSGDCSGMLALGEDKTCTLTNDDQPAQIKLTKVVDNTNFNGNDVVTDFILSVDGGTVTSGSTTPVDSNKFIPIAETGTNLAGYTPTIAGDTGADLKCPTAVGGNTQKLNEGETLDCTITNDDKPAKITLIKVPGNEIDGTGRALGVNAFGMTIGATGVNSNQQLDVDSNTVIAINESVPTGYEFVSLSGGTCPIDTGSLGDTVTLIEGEVITCTITNNDIPLDFEWTGLGDGTSFNDGANWDQGIPPASFDRLTIPAGTFTVELTADHTITGTLEIGAGSSIDTKGFELDIDATGTGDGTVGISGTLINTGTSITIGVGTTLTNTGTITNGGTFTVNGDLVNGDVGGTTPGTFNNNSPSGFILLSTTGTLTINKDSTVTNTNSISNDGTINNFGTINTSFSLISTGTLNNGDGAGTTPGAIVNTKFLNNGDAIGVNTGTINNKKDSTISSTDSIQNFPGSIINNDGTITVTAGSFTSGTFNGAHPDGTINNNADGVITFSGTGTFQNAKDDIINNAGEITFPVSSGAFENNGIVSNTGDFTHNGFSFDNLGGSISNTGSGVIDLNTAVDNSAPLTNSATINFNGGTFDNNDVINNSGDLIIKANGFENLVTITNTGTSINIGAGFTFTNSGTLTNKGLIINNGTLTNTGTLTNGDGVVEALLHNQLGGSLVNSATFNNEALSIVGVNSSSSSIVNNSPGVFTNKMGALVNTNRTSTINNNFGATFDNIGTILNRGAITNDGTLSNTSPFNNLCAGTFTPNVALTGGSDPVVDNCYVTFAGTNPTSQFWDHDATFIGTFTGDTQAGDVFTIFWADAIGTASSVATIDVGLETFSDTHNYPFGNAASAHSITVELRDASMVLLHASADADLGNDPISFTVDPHTTVLTIDDFTQVRVDGDLLDNTIPWQNDANIDISLQDQNPGPGATTGDLDGSVISIDDLFALNSLVDPTFGNTATDTVSLTDILLTVAGPSQIGAQTITVSYIGTTEFAAATDVTQGITISDRRTTLNISGFDQLIDEGDADSTTIPWHNQVHVDLALEDIDPTQQAITQAPFLNYDGGTASSPFAAGETIIGGTSGATAFVLGVVGDEFSGTLALSGITGTFQDDEVITGSGPAFVDGTLNSLDLDNSAIAYTDAGALNTSPVNVNTGDESSSIASTTDDLLTISDHTNIGAQTITATYDGTSTPYITSSDNQPITNIKHRTQTFNILQASTTANSKVNVAGEVRDLDKSALPSTLLIEGRTIDITGNGSANVPNSGLTEGINISYDGSSDLINTFLLYDGGDGLSGTGFTAGDTITGGTSGATATVTAVFGDTDSGLLKLTDVLGIFDDNEQITGSGPALVDGGLTQLTIDYDTGDGGLFTAGNEICSPACQTASINATILGVASGDGSSGTLILNLPVGGDLDSGDEITESADGGDGIGHAFLSSEFMGASVPPEPEIRDCTLVSSTDGCFVSPINVLHLGIGSGFDIRDGGSTFTATVQDIGNRDFSLSFFGEDDSLIITKPFVGISFEQSHFELMDMPIPAMGGAAFTVGETLTGGTTGETAVITEIIGDKLYVDNISGEFSAIEIITGSISTSMANASGAIFDPDIPNVSYGTNQNITKVVVANVTASGSDDEIPDGTVGFTNIKITTPSGKPALTHERNFATRALSGGEELPVTDPGPDTITSSSLTISSGVYFVTGQAPPSDDLNYRICAEFAGDGFFKPAPQVCSGFDVGAVTSGASTAAGFSLTPADFTGTSFTAVAAAADHDGDSLKNKWDRDREIIYFANSMAESYPIPVVDPTGNGAYSGTLITVPPLPSTVVKDIFVEIDYMEGHKPNVESLNNVIASFTNAPVEGRVGNDDNKGIRLHLYVDEELDHVNDMQVWRDDDTVYNNDFKSIKDRHFGFASEAWSLGDPANTIEFTISPTIKRVRVFDLPISTPASPTNHDGTITFQVFLNFSASTCSDTNCATASITGINKRAILGVNSPFKATSFGFTPTFEQVSTTPNVWIMTFVQSNYRSSAAVTTPLDSGDWRVDYIVDKDLGTTRPEATFIADSQYIVSKLHEAKAQIFHYTIFSHTLQGFDDMGMPVSGCGGPSGVAEGPGNDVVISLGCNWDENEDSTGVPINANNLDDIGITGVTGSDAMVNPVHPLYGDQSPALTGSNQATTGSKIQQASTFMHELGHNFDLLHGGPLKLLGTSGLNNPFGPSINCKPNYASIMSYSRQTEEHFTTANDHVLDYSRGQFASVLSSQGFGPGTPTSLIEGSLNEIIGLASFPAGSIEIIFGAGGTPTAVTADGSSINWNDSGGFTDPVSADINNMGIPGCGSSAGQTLSDTIGGDWDHLLYDFRNADGGSFDAVVPTDPLTQRATAAFSAQNEWYNGLTPDHFLYPIGFDNDRDGSRGEDPIETEIDNDSDGLFSEDPSEQVDNDGDGLFSEDPVDTIDNDLDGQIDEDPMETEIDNDSDGLFSEDPSEQVDNDGDGLFGEDPPEANNIVRRANDAINVLYQNFNCSPENILTVDHPNFVELGTGPATLAFGPFCYDEDLAVVESGFYEQLELDGVTLKNQVETNPGPAAGKDPGEGCGPGSTLETSIQCNPRKLQFVDLSKDPDRGWFLQIARLSVADNSLNSDECVTRSFPVHVHLDEPYGFNHLLIKGDDLPDDGLLNPFTTTGPECDALPGAGVYAFDLFIGAEDPDNSGNFKAAGLANDDALFGIFGTENDIPAAGPENISGYRVATGAEMSFKVTITEDPI